MGGIRFELKPVAEKPKRTYTKRSKYGPIIDAFLSGGHDLVRLEVEGKDVNYMRVQLVRVIKSRNLVGLVEALVANDELYLEKIG